MTLILDDVKDYIGVPDGGFDSELLLIINSFNLDLTQIGINEAEVLEVTSSTDWSIYSNHPTTIGALRVYICVATKLTFDHPTNPTQSQALGRIATRALAMIADFRSVEKMLEENP